MFFAVLIIVLIVCFIFFTRKRNKSTDILKEKIDKIDFGNNNGELKIVQVSDIHYIDSSITDFGNSFINKVEKADGRSIRYIDQILDSFILEMIKESPDVIVVSGDLTYNGEKISHQVLSRKLQILRKKGIEVLVIPGNHDIENENAKKFEGDKTFEVESVSPEEFKNIYKDFGYSDENPRVVGRDKNSLSYMYMVAPDKCVLMVESSYGKNNLEISNQTFTWIERMLNIANKNNISVISVTHENILAHNKMFISGYKIDNSAKLVDLYSKYNVRLNLSGHMHLQHISENEGVIDAAIGCIALYPNLYALVYIDKDNTLDYHTEALEVSEWALKYGWKDDNLINFKSYSRKKFDSIGISQASPILEKIDITLEEKRRMMKFMLDTCAAYFSGTLSEYPNLNADSEEYGMWKKYCENTFLMSFLNSIYIDKTQCHNKFKI